MASDNPQIIGGTEIISLYEYPEVLIIGEEYTLVGGIKGNIQSSTVKLLINNEEKGTAMVENGEFSFTLSMMRALSPTANIKILGMSEGVVKSEWSVSIPIRYHPVAQTLIMTYSSLKEVLEDVFFIEVEEYDFEEKNGDGLESMVGKFEKFVGI